MKTKTAGLINLLLAIALLIASYFSFLWLDLSYIGKLLAESLKITLFLFVIVGFLSNLLVAIFRIKR